MFAADAQGATPRRGSNERPTASSGSRTRKIGVKKNSVESKLSSGQRKVPGLKELYNIEETADRKNRFSNKKSDASPTPEAKTISPRRRLVHLSNIQYNNVNNPPSTLSPMEIAGAYGDKLIT